jgi:hypothetical protein
MSRKKTKFLPPVLFIPLKGYLLWRENGCEERRLNSCRLYYLYLWGFKGILWRGKDVKKED